MNSIIVSTLLLAMTATVYANTCSATITAVARAGAASSWTDNGVLHTIYDISASNTGTCDITSLSSYFYSDGYKVSSSWNYNNDTGKISSPTLAPQALFNGAGFVLTGPNAPSQLYIRGDCGACGGFYSTSSAPGTVLTSAPATPAPTVAPVDACGGCQINQICVNTQTGYQCDYRQCSNTVCPANQRSICINDGGVARCISTGSTQCLASATVKARANGQFEANGVTNQIYDIIVSGYSVSSATIEIDPSTGSSVGDAWNLSPQSTVHQYTLEEHGSLSSSTTAAYYGAGFVLRNVTSEYAPKVGVSSVTCV